MASLSFRLSNRNSLHEGIYTLASRELGHLWHQAFCIYYLLLANCKLFYCNRYNFHLHYHTQFQMLHPSNNMGSHNPHYIYYLRSLR